MPKYLLQVNYTPEGARGLHKDGGVKRREAAAFAAQSVGGSLEAFYFSFGSQDAVCICEMPDAVSMAALSLAVTGTGAAETVTTTLLLPGSTGTALSLSADLAWAVIMRGRGMKPGSLALTDTSRSV